MLFVFLKKLGLVLLNILLLVLIVIPILSVFFLPLLIYRHLVIFLVTCVYRLESVSPRDAVLANDDYTGNPKSTIVIPLTIHGNIDLEYVKGEFENKMINAKHTKSEVLKYPQLKQYFTPKWGYLFRKYEAKFDLGQHVVLLDKKNKIFTQEDLTVLRKKLLHEPYAEGTSPWQIILIDNFQPDLPDENNPDSTKKYSLVVAKFHHGLVDGYSLLGLFLNTVNISTGKKALVKPKFVKKSIWKKIKFALKIILFLPSTLLSQVPPHDAANIFSPSKYTKLAPERHPVTCKVPTAVVKSTSKDLGVCFTAVLMAALTGGIRNYILAKNKDVPKVIDVVIPLPWPGHPDKIKNFFTFASLNLPVGLPSSDDRVYNLHKCILNLKKSIVPTINFCIVPITGSLPLRIMKMCLINTPSSILMSNFPAPQSLTSFFQYELFETQFEGGYGQAPLGMGVTMNSYNGQITISINPQENMVPTKADSEHLLSLIIKELYVLQSNSIV